MTRLLGFDLLARIKRINEIRLYRPLTGEPDAYPLFWAHVAPYGEIKLDMRSRLTLNTPND